MSLFFCITFFPGLVVFSAGQDKGIPSPETAIGFLEAYYDQFRQVSFVVEQTYDSGSGSANAGPEHKTVEVSRVQKDKDSWKVRSSTRTTYYDEAKKQYCTASYEQENIATPERGLTISIAERGEVVRGILADLTRRSAVERFGFLDFVPLVSSYFFGNGTAPLPDVLRQSRLSVRRGTYEGQPALVIEGEGAHGMHRVVLDIARNHMPRRFIQQKASHHRMNDHIMSQLPKEVGGGLEAAEYELVITEVDMRDGRYVPVKARAKSRSVDRNGSVHEVLTEMKLSQWEFDKSISFEPDTPIPDGTPVTVDGERHIDYEWRRGKIVKRIPEGTVQALVGHWFQAGGLIGTTTLILLLLTLAGLATYLWYRRKVAVK